MNTNQIDKDEIVKTIGVLSDPCTVEEISNAHARVYNYNITIDKQYGDSNRASISEWCRLSTKVLDSIVEDLGNGNPKREKMIENILKPIRKSVMYRQQEMK